MIIYDVVEKLIGPVDASGDHGRDMERLANLKEMTDLVDALVRDIRYAAQTAGHHADSMNQIGTTAKKYLDGLREELSDD